MSEPTVQRYCETCQKITTHIVVKNRYALCIPCVKRHEDHEQSRD